MRTVMLSMSLLLAAGCSSRDPATPPPPPPPQAASPLQAIASVAELMRAMTIPSSNALFAAQGEAPQDDAAWLSVQTNALLLAESGNLLMIGSRARDHADWDTRSRALIDAAVLALTAARAKDAVSFGQAADAIYASCEACHRQYLAQ